MDEQEKRDKFERLKLLLDRTTLNYFADPDKGVCLVRFADMKTDFDTVFVYLQGAENDIIVATLTLLDGEKGYHYTKEIYEACLKFNKKVALLKAQFDERYGDIDLSYETWLAILPEHLQMGIELLVSHGNALVSELRRMLAKQSQPLEKLSEKSAN